jgi:hypothetical protein
MATQATTAPSPTDRWRIYVVCYLLWVALFAVFEGAGRKACNMPMQKWIDAAGTPRERSLRVWFQDRANECLDRTRWYSYSMAGLFALGPLAPFGVAWIVRRRVMPAATSRPGPSVKAIKIAALLYSAAFLAALGVTLGTMKGVRWLYDWLG